MKAKPTSIAMSQPSEVTGLEFDVIAMNEALVLSSVRQHELTEAADWANTQLAKEIREHEQAEAEIRRLNAELEERVVERTAEMQAANAELLAFSYSVSHDLRAPLRHVMGFVNLLEQDAGPSLSKTNQQHLRTISQAAKRMGALIDDLLSFSRVGHGEMQKANVNLTELVQEIMRDFQAETN